MPLCQNKIEFMVEKDYLLNKPMIKLDKKNDF